MKTLLAIAVVAGAIGTSACGATRTTSTSRAIDSVYPTLTSAVATFVSTEHGKDADSSLTVEMLRSNAELAGNLQVTGTRFDDNSSSGPFAFSLSGPFTTQDIDNGQVRVRFVPDGADDWTFDLHLMTRYTDGTARNFVWRGVRLDNISPERVLMLAPARVP